MTATNAYLLSIALLIFNLLFGYSISSINPIKVSRISSWILLLISASCMYWLMSGMTPFEMMVMIILALLLSIKSIVYTESVHAGKGRISLLAYLCFSLGWLGMRPYIFQTLGQPSIPGYFQFFLQGIKNSVIGIIFIILGNLIFQHNSLAATILFLIGLSFILHFGIISFQIGFWRIFGIHTQLLFKDPYLSKSLSEFWSHRWNLAFSEMTSITLFRPLKTHIGPTASLWICFLVSGAFHEMAISVPVKHGYGLPTLFFLIQAGGLSLEQRESFKKLSITAKRVWTFAWLLFPAPILFHIYFVKEIVWKTLLH